MAPLITNIVFTKNRPLQLQAYLESLRRHFSPELVQTHIIYKPEFFGTEYESVFRLYPDCHVVYESDFHTDCLSLIRNADTKYMLFGVDDVVYFDSVDIGLIDRTFTEHGDDIFGFSFRYGLNSIDNSAEPLESVRIGDDEIYRLDWPNGATKHTRYPFELNCTVYATTLVNRILSGAMTGNPLVYALFRPNAPLIQGLRRILSPRKILKAFGYFFSPNTLESWNCRWSKRNPTSLPRYTYFQRLCACAIQVNVVNTSTASDPWGTDEHTVETLNEKFKAGYRFDIDNLVSNKPNSLNGGPEFFKLVRSATHTSRT